MENQNQLVVSDPQAIEKYTLSPEQISKQIQVIQKVMSVNMKDGEHYGVIEGCGPKPTLLKPGAEKLNLLFRFAPKYEVKQTDIDERYYPCGHREYQIKCTLIHIPTGAIVGEGVGVCSTLETKYRYRGSEWEETGELVPKEYWNLRKADPKAALELIGGKGYGTQKIDNIWKIVKKGEKMENPNIADTYNTVIKIAKKRAHVDATLTATAASDIFTQDLEDIKDNLKGEQDQLTNSPSKAVKEPQTGGDQSDNALRAVDGNNPASDAEVKQIYDSWKKAIKSNLKNKDDLPEDGDLQNIFLKVINEADFSLIQKSKVGSVKAVLDNPKQLIKLIDTSFQNYPLDGILRKTI